MTWRTGTKNPHTLYLDEGGVSLPQGFIMNPGAARAIVEAMNAAEPVVDDPVWLRNEVRRLRGVLKEMADRAEAERAPSRMQAQSTSEFGLAHAEQLVLDACAAAKIDKNDCSRFVFASEEHAICEAELARRKLAP